MKRLLPTLLLLSFTPTASALLDTNGNGLSDLWERQHNNGDLFDETFDPQADPDGDGWTSAKEAAAGTDPFEPNPPDGLVRPLATHIPAVYGEPDGEGNPTLVSPEAVVVSWPTIAGKQYSLLYSPDLSAGSWQPVEDPVIATGGTLTYTFLTDSSDKLFWRVAIADVDSDSDGLSDAEEHELGTNPLWSDSDGDGLNDMWEILNARDPNNGDENGNGYFDGLDDDDGDGVPNQDEAADGTGHLDGNQFLPKMIMVSKSAEGSSNTVAYENAQYPYNGWYRYGVSWDNAAAVYATERQAPVNPAYLQTVLDTMAFPVLPPTPPDGTAFVLNIPATLASVSGANYPAAGGGMESSVGSVRVWLKVPAGEHEQRFHFIKYRERSIRHIAANTIEIESVSHEFIELIVPANGTLSDSVDLHYPPSAEAGKDITFYEKLIPITIRWQEIGSYTDASGTFVEAFENLDVHIDPWTEIANGLRIFPDLKNPDATRLRNAVDVIVSTSSALAGKTVRVRAYDIDDSTSEEFDHDPFNPSSGPVIDTEGRKGNDNLPDYLGTPQTGRFLENGTWGDDSAEAILDAAGKAKFTFQVGMQPGNNYKIVVTEIDEKTFPAVQVTDPSQVTYLGPEPTQAGKAPSTPMLTVWRKLWVENDSMETMDTDGHKRNDLSSDIANPIVNHVELTSDGTGTIIYFSPISDSSSFLQLENGRIIVQGVVHDVKAAGIVNTDDHVVLIDGDFTDIPVGASFRLYDDDDLGVDQAPLPRLNLAGDQMAEYFKPAFIEIADAAAFNPNKLVPFRRNEDVFSTGLFGQENTVVNDAMDLTDRKELWVAPLTAAYQGPMDADKDPNNIGEGHRQGETVPFGDFDHSTVFVEGCRENYWIPLKSDKPNTVANANIYLRKWIVAVAAHEIGHQPGHQSEATDHAEGLLLSKGLDSVSHTNPESAKFSAKTIKRYRKSLRWSD